MIDLGHIALLLALSAAIFSAVASLLAVRSGRSAWIARAEMGLVAVVFLLAMATAALLQLLLSRDFQAQYVYAHASSYQPPVYLVSALWAGQEGSLLLWSLLFGAVTVIFIRQERWRSDETWPYVLTALTVTHVLFAWMLATVQNPFISLPTRPEEGLGILPTLEHPGMVVHPPILFLGYAICGVPFASAIGRLLAGRMNFLDRAQSQQIRRWSILAWLFLGVGIIIGAWWAYVELGWGGYWSWDPVESASLLPWLTATAYIHSLMAQERAGIFKRWNAILPIATFLLCVFATFVTRGGIILSDLHGFSQSIQPVAAPLLGFIGLAAALSGVLIYSRRGQLRDTEQEEQWLSQGSMLLVSNLLFLGLAVAVFIGIVFPTLSQVLWGAQLYLGQPFYNRVFVPLGAVIVFLLAICPLLGWRATSSRKLVRRISIPVALALVTATLLFIFGWRQLFAILLSSLFAFAGGTILSQLIRQTRRQPADSQDVRGVAPVLLRGARRHWGAHLVHLAIVLIAIAVAGSSLGKMETLITLAREETATVGSYALKYENLSVVDEPGKRRHIATVGVYAGQARLGTLRPEKNFYWNTEDWITEVAIRSTPRDDLYIALAQPAEDGRITFRVSIYPLVVWLWIGGAILLLGTVLAVWPISRESGTAL